MLVAEGCTDMVTLLNPQASREVNFIRQVSARASATGIDCMLVHLRDGVNLTPLEREAVLSAVIRTCAGLRAGRRIFLHCRAGRNRSRMVALAVLLAGGLAESEALALIRSIRPGVAAPLGNSRRRLATDLGRAAALMLRT